MNRDYRALFRALDPYELAMADIPPTPLFGHYLVVMEDFLETESQEYHENHPYHSMIFELENILRESFFAALYASFESYLVGMCDEHISSRKTNKVGKAVHLLVEDESVRSSLYRSPEWKEIDNYRILRNCIVHDSGSLTPHTKERRRLEDFILSKRPLLRLSYNSIFLSRQFCKEAVDVIDVFSIAVLVESGRLISTHQA
jgi:hypothetical protein